jgi:hypothetical protein
VTFAAVGVGVWLAIRDSITETVDKDLRSRLAAMREFLQHQASDGDESIDEWMEDAALAPAGTRFRIANGDGRWLYQSPGSDGWGAAPPDVARLPKEGRTETMVWNGKPVRILTAAAPPGLLQIGIPIDEFTEMLNEFTWMAGLASPMLLLLASGAGYWMSRRA